MNPVDNSYKLMRDLEVVQPKMIITINDSYKNLKHAARDAKINMDFVVFPAVRSIDNKVLDILYGGKQIISGNALLNTNKSLDKLLKEGKNIEEVVYDTTYKKGQLGNIVFTGGSSGVHKGVDLDSNGLNSVVRGIDYVANLEPGEVFMGNLPQFMAFGIFTLHYALCKNLETELTLKAMPADFIDELKRIRPNGVFGGPIHWNTLLDKENIEKELDLSDLKLPVSGGEQLPIEKWHKINEVLEKCGCKDYLWNGLGSSEMWAPVSVCRGKKNTIGSIGTIIPFNNQKIMSLDGKRELDYGEIGLLYLSGPGMMLGYHNNKEETNKVIEYDENGVRWLNTGDLASLSEEGELTFVGREKRCFVSGVENIYPEQIENLISTIPEIRESIVTHIPDDNNQNLPIYHISLYDKNCNIDALEKKINKLILSTLGSSALAGRIDYTLNRLPVTKNGKLDPKPLQKKDLEEYYNSKKMVLKK
jgi:long-chain acyl-CoA synthetase